MAEVNTSIYQIAPQNPLDNVSKIYGIVNADQQLNLARQAEQVRQFELMQHQANDLRSSVGPLANVPGISRAEVLATMAQRAKQLGIHPKVYEQAAAPFSDPNLRGDKLQKMLTIQGVGAAGPGSLTQRQEGVDSQGRTTSYPAPQAYGKPVATGIGPAATAAQTATGGGAGALLTQARDNSIQFPRQVFPLEQAISALERLGPQGTGPGTDAINQIKSFAQSMGLPGVDAGKIVDYDSAKKYLTDFVNQTGNSGTNEKLQAAFAGNPSVHISNEAAVKVSKAALSLRRFDEARQRAFDAANAPDDQFAKFAGKWGREHDVRAFGFDLMTPKQRQAVLEPMTKGQRDLFMMDVDEAKNNGLIRPPRILPPPTGKK